MRNWANGAFGTNLKGVELGQARPKDKRPTLVRR